MLTILPQDLFENATMWLRDTGVLDKLRLRALNPAIPIPDPKGRHNQPLTVYQLGITAIIYLVGISISIFAFLTELIKFREVRPQPENATELNDIQVANEQSPTQIIISSIE